MATRSAFNSEASAIIEEILALRKSGGFSRLDAYCLIKVSGPEAASFLQTRLSNDVKLLGDGQGQMTSLLDRKAKVIAYASLHRLSDDYYFLLERSQKEVVLQQLEQYHFREKVEFQLLEGSLWTVQGPRTPLWLRQMALPMIAEELSCVHALMHDSTVLMIRRTLTGEPGYIIFSDIQRTVEFVATFEGAAEALHMVPMSEAGMNVARVEAGLPEYGIDFDIETSLPETGLETIAASYSKGCFQGQEVLARVKTYGAPSRGLVGLEFEGAAEPLPFNSSMQIDGTECGAIRSSVYSPTFEKVIALAYVKRELRVPDTKISATIGGHPYQAKVVILPFYDQQKKSARAKTLYDRALQEFSHGTEEESIRLLEEALVLDPLLSDAYEALGVVLSRHERLDEAIALMKELDLLDPDSIMAHTNLSVFYMQKGDKEAAEEEKAKAMNIRMSQMARDMASERKVEQERESRKAAAHERMDMFNQVLKIDPEDFLANAGLGSAFVDLEDHEKALPFLQKALAIKPNHTVAYLSLGEAYEKLGRVAEAVETYRKGVTIASQRGDITPMKEMQSRLAKLE